FPESSAGALPCTATGRRCSRGRAGTARPDKCTIAATDRSRVVTSPRPPLPAVHATLSASGACPPVASQTIFSSRCPFALPFHLLIRLRSRDAPGARGLPRHAKNAPRTKRGERSADRRTTCPRLRSAAARLAPPSFLPRKRGRVGRGRRARLSALHRGACHANQCHGSAQAALHAKQRAKALPSPWLALAAMHLARRSLCRQGRCPDRPGAGLQAPPAGTALAPSLGCHRSTTLR